MSKDRTQAALLWWWFSCGEEVVGGGGGPGGGGQVRAEGGARAALGGHRQADVWYLQDDSTEAHPTGDTQTDHKAGQRAL